MRTLKEETDRYIDACNYPGIIDDNMVERHLASYLSALGIKRKIKRLSKNWTLEDNKSLDLYVRGVIEEFKAMDAMAAIDARDAMAAMAAMDARDAMAARDARDAIRRFTVWCITRGGWYWCSEISYLSVTYLGSKQLSGDRFIPWSKAIFDAFCAGCWIIHWTDDTLYWVSKPSVRVDSSRRLHCENSPAIESDLEDLYFWKGVMVPEMVVIHPEKMTPKSIMSEENTQVRMVMIERYGFYRFMLDAGAKTLNSVGEYSLISVPDPEWGEIKALKMVCPSTGKVFVIPTDPKHEKVSTALDEMKSVQNYLERIRLQT